MESSFLMRDQALSLWSGIIDSKALDYQRTKPKEYQIVRTHTKETTWTPPPEPPCAGASSKQQTKQRYKPIISRQDRLLTQPCLSEENKQANSNNTKKTQHKISPYTRVTKTTGPNLGEQKPKGRQNSILKTGKRRSKTQ